MGTFFICINTYMYKTNICQENKTPWPVKITARMLGSLSCWQCLSTSAFFTSSYSNPTFQGTRAFFVNISLTGFFYLPSLLPSVTRAVHGLFCCLVDWYYSQSRNSVTKRLKAWIFIFIIWKNFGENLAFTFLQHNSIFFYKSVSFCRRHHARFIWFSNN